MVVIGIAETCSFKATVFMQVKAALPRRRSNKWEEEVFARLHCPSSTARSAYHAV